LYPCLVVVVVLQVEEGDSERRQHEETGRPCGGEELKGEEEGEDEWYREQGIGEQMIDNE
jgi:hypothetical protein